MKPITEQHPSELRWSNIQISIAFNQRMIDALDLKQSMLEFNHWEVLKKLDEIGKWRAKK